ncbi:protein-L-isoaspartate carboxylmethyltransferase [Beggiatoa alba B18LD]|uniref:Protein-L-isoaspartate O-methyltransferase n=1 Tax=Beggiatoa alba B18LD TaxID=395493 RepID=I3CD92_9GAMM|nr:protein-L-isoaspartate O-methyltransferase [Beggiatoa alba]EIJ41585.1 protein-L-isoaspartate carboxylmethyltransferase [Beggiatoa alba B18LD]
MMSSMNIEQARFNMIEQQIRPWDVLDPRVLNAMTQTPREFFVPETYQQLAFADISIPLANGQEMLPPKVQGRVAQSLLLDENDTVLEVGTGNGYLTALLAKLADKVESVDIYEEFTKLAASKLQQLGIHNVILETGDAANGWKQEKRYDAIVLTGSVPVLKPYWQEQLKIGGRLFVIVGESPIMQARVVTRLSDKEWATDYVFETDVPALVNAPQPSRFVL